MEDLTLCVDDVIFFLCPTGSNNIRFWPGEHEIHVFELICTSYNIDGCRDGRDWKPGFNTTYYELPCTCTSNHDILFP